MIGQFIGKCIDLHKLDAALEEAEKGIREYPNSSALADAYKRLIRTKCADDLRTYRDELRKAPGPKAYYKLACLYKEMRDLDQAVETARKGSELYPDFEGNYIVLADLRYERFQRDLRASDGAQAIDLFEKAVDLNRENYRLLFQLAEIYQAIGAKKEGLEKVNMILDFAPDDRKALALLDSIQSMKTGKVEKTLKDILGDFERRASTGNVFKPGVLAQRYTRNPDHLARKLPALERISGFQRAVVLGPNGELLAGYPGGPEENSKYGDMLRKLFTAAIDCSLRMDISTFEMGLIESENGFTFLTVIDRLQIAVLASDKGKKDRLMADVRKFLEHDLYT